MKINLLGNSIRQSQHLEPASVKRKILHVLAALRKKSFALVE
jgi:hypothetical protein